MSALLDDLERAAQRIRDHFNTHRLWDTIMLHLDELIDAGRKLRTDRDGQKARADQAEVDLAALKQQIAGDEQKAADAAAEIEAQVPVEDQAPAQGNASITAVVTAPIVAGSITVPVALVAVQAIADAVDTAASTGSTVAVNGAAVSTGTTVTAADTMASTITLSAPTIADHVGDGTEMLTMTTSAA